MLGRAPRRGPARPRRHDRGRGPGRPIVLAAGALWRRALLRGDAGQGEDEVACGRRARACDGGKPGRRRARGTRPRRLGATGPTAATSMNDTLGVSAAGVPAALDADLKEPGDFRGRNAGATAALVHALFRKRREFGITRAGVDDPPGPRRRLGCPGRAPAIAVQCRRPGQGRQPARRGRLGAHGGARDMGRENASRRRVSRRHGARQLGDEVRSLYAGCLVHGFDAGWDQLPLRWIEGCDLSSAAGSCRCRRRWSTPSTRFPRPTRWRSRARRPALPRALRCWRPSSMPRWRCWSGRAWRRRSGARVFDEWQVKAEDVDWPGASEILARLKAADLVAGIWLVPTEHGLPIYWCHVIEGEGRRELAPLPGEGFGCDFTHDARPREGAAGSLPGAGDSDCRGARGHHAPLLSRALRARATCGVARRLASPPGTRPLPRDGGGPGRASGAPPRPPRARSSRGAGGHRRAALQRRHDPRVEVVRLVAPPLRVRLRSDGWRATSSSSSARR